MKHPQHRRSIFLGSLAAAIAPPVCLLVPEMLRLSDRGSFGYLLSNSAIFLTVAIPVSLAAMLCIGLPYALWLRSRGSLNAISICAGSMVIGVGVFSLLTWTLTWDNRLPGLLQMVLGAGQGLAAGQIVFVGLAVHASSEVRRFRRRPEGARHQKITSRPPAVADP